MVDFNGTLVDPQALSLVDIRLILAIKVQKALPDFTFVDKWLHTYVGNWWSSYVMSLYTKDYSGYHIVLEILLFLVLLKLIITPRGRVSLEGEKLTDQEIEEMIDAYTPEPLMDELNDSERKLLQRPVVVGPVKPITKFIDGVERINVSTFNFLGLIGDKEAEKATEDSILCHGVGSCGPRGFYGTIDSHVHLEEELAEFLGTEEAILYSYGFATVTSAIPAYSKRNDVIFCDMGVSFAVQKGLQASRSSLRWFKHNDMEDLERVLKVQEEEDKRIPAKAIKIRRFLVIEGLYTNYGDICPLPKIVELKYRYKFRIFMDESISFGVLGRTGKGVTEHFGVDIHDIDMVCASLENALGTVGGFCAGSTFLIDHQRLSGAGYCFSASLPPFLADVAICGLKRMITQTDMTSTLQKKAMDFREQLGTLLPQMLADGDDISPLVHLRFKNSSLPFEQQDDELQKVVDKCFDTGVAISRAKYILEEEVYPIQPSLRLIVSLGHTDE
eukprot:Ihof_evm4s35 gene=Ihof_evmTU4s35